MLKVFIESNTIDSCKKAIQGLTQEDKSFKEVGGYMLGTFDGVKFNIKYLHLDKYAESTSVRIKLSVDAFHEVEQMLSEFPGSIYIGTWHVHPGLGKPMYSQTDVSSLFIERFVLETDNPENVDCPKIHLIFNSLLTEYSCFTMDLKMDFLSISLDSSIGENIIQSELVDIELDILNESKDLLNNPSLENYYKLQKNIEDTYDNLDLLSEQIGFALDFLNETEWYKKNEIKIDKVIKNAIKQEERLGIISFEDEKNITNLKYRPKIINQSLSDGNLIGFWVLFSYENFDEMFLKIFYANFFKKVNCEPGTFYLFFLVQKSEEKIVIYPFFLNFTSFEGISYIELETTLGEEDLNENNVSEP